MRTWLAGATPPSSTKTQFRPTHALSTNTPAPKSHMKHAHALSPDAPAFTPQQSVHPTVCNPMLTQHPIAQPLTQEAPPSLPLHYYFSLQVTPQRPIAETKFPLQHPPCVQLPPAFPSVSPAPVSFPEFWPDSPKINPSFLQVSPPLSPQPTQHSLLSATSPNGNNRNVGSPLLTIKHSEGEHFCEKNAAEAMKDVGSSLSTIKHSEGEINSQEKHGTGCSSIRRRRRASSSSRSQARIIHIGESGHRYNIGIDTVTVTVTIPLPPRFWPRCVACYQNNAIAECSHCGANLCGDAICSLICTTCQAFLCVNGDCHSYHICVVEAKNTQKHKEVESKNDSNEEKQHKRWRNQATDDSKTHVGSPLPTINHSFEGEKCYREVCDEDQPEEDLAEQRNDSKVCAEARTAQALNELKDGQERPPRPSSQVD